MHLAHHRQLIIFNGSVMELQSLTSWNDQKKNILSVCVYLHFPVISGHKTLFIVNTGMLDN